ncbi:MAG TPA: DNA polymerase III subunit gamma/tau [Bacteroidaceae bacterium]|nr:DNA polymerase III subunit gamma/tau [Bacteroidaceae bacterium]
MNAYKVSARKYRPTTFNSVVGQDALTTTLKNAIVSGKLATSYLFCGPRGVGKTTCARIFAKTVNCLNRNENGEPCGQCESCKTFDSDSRSYNVFELDAASNNSVDDIRTLTEQVRIPPINGKYKVYIIDEVHMLSSSAFNAFLKTLEEPPSYAIFILATTEKHKIIPTILSRCQIYDFNRISYSDIAAYLAYVAEQENITAHPDALEIIAEKADGGLRDALSIFDQVVSFTQGNVTYQSTILNLNILDYNYYFRLTEMLLGGLIPDSLLLLNEVLGKGFDGSHFINGLTSHFRNLLVSRDSSTLPLLGVGIEIQKRYIEQATYCKPDFLIRAMKLCNDCDLNYRSSKNKRLYIELSLIQIAQLSSQDKKHPSGQNTKKIKPLFNKENNSNPTTTTTVKSDPETNIQNSPISRETTQRVKSREIPKISDDKLFTSIRQTPQHTSSDNTQKEPTPILVENNNKVKKNLTPDMLEYYWKEYAMKLKSEDTPLANRMLITAPQLLSKNHIKVVIQNQMAAQDFISHKSKILKYIRTVFNNNSISMTIEIDESKENSRIMSRSEQYQSLKKSNESLQTLEDIFGLDLA